MGRFASMRIGTLLSLFLPLVLQLNALTVNFHYGQFMTSDGLPYIETYMLFNGSDMRYVSTDDSTFQAHVELTYVFEQNGKVIDFSKINVHSPLTNDTVNQLIDFTDQQRFQLPNGEYDLTILLYDINNPIDSVRSVQPVKLEVNADGIDFSDIYFVERIQPTINQNFYTRNGMDYFPRLSTFFPPAAEYVWFYAEIYNSDKVLGTEGAYVFTTEIINPETDEVVDQYRTLKRMKASRVQPVASKLKIESLRSGNYELRLEARDKNNKLLASQSREFKRYSDQQFNIEDIEIKKTFVDNMEEDSLRVMTYCLIWNSTESEVQFIEDNWKEGDTTELQRFFYQYWYDRNPIDPRLQWARYHQSIKTVEDEFTNSTMHGCQTDRGRVYLKYGVPDSRSIARNEAHSYPYEIWHYYKVPGKSNAKFFFLDNRRMNEYLLGHSNVFGEPTDQLWYTRVVRETQGGSQSAAEQTQEALMQERDPYSHGSRALDYWNNPR